MHKTLKKPGVGARAMKALRGMKVLGMTTDGIRILKPRGKSKHFTQKELREAIAAARAARRTG